MEDVSFSLPHVTWKSRGGNRRATGPPPDALRAALPVQDVVLLGQRLDLEILDRPDVGDRVPLFQTELG